MKRKCIQVLLILTAVATDLKGQIEIPPDEFARLPVDEALKISNNVLDGYGVPAYAKAAVDSKRMDLIQACFRSGVTCEYIRNAIGDLPESSYKDSLILMMLETQSWYWPDYDRGGSFPVAIAIDQKPFGDFIKKWLPNRKFNKETTPEIRKQLADEIRESKTDAENPDSLESVKHPEAEQLKQNGREEASTAISEPQASDFKNSRKAWIFSILVFGIIVTIWFKLWTSRAKVRK